MRERLAMCTNLPEARVQVNNPQNVFYLVCCLPVELPDAHFKSWKVTLKAKWCWKTWRESSYMLWHKVVHEVLEPNTDLYPFFCQVWFKNRRAKFRKKQRSLQKEQLQKQKEASGAAEGSTDDSKTDLSTATNATTLVPEAHTPPPPSSSSSCHSEAERLAAARPQPGEMSVEVNVTSPELSDSESAAEDTADREEGEMRGEVRVKLREETQGEAGAQPGSSSPSCKRLSPTSGKNTTAWIVAPLFLIVYLI